MGVGAGSNSGSVLLAHEYWDAPCLTEFGVVCGMVGGIKVAGGGAEGIPGCIDEMSVSRSPTTASVTRMLLVLVNRARATAQGLDLLMGKSTPSLCSQGIELVARVPVNGDSVVEIPSVVVFLEVNGQGAAGRDLASLRCELLLHLTRPEALA